MNINVYTASFTSGALMLSESDSILDFLLKHDVSQVSILKDSTEYLKINSKVARSKKVGEILKRYKSNKLSYWDFYRGLHSKEERYIFLYFICLNTYSLIRDFHLEFVLSNWRQLKTAINRDDVLRFLSWSSVKHPEIDKWTENTRNKVGQIIILMMKEVGILVNGKLTTVYLSEELCRFFARSGESWFLEAMFIPKEQRERIINSL